MRKLFSAIISSLVEGRIKEGLLSLALFASASAIYASDTQVDGIWYDFDYLTQTASVTYQGYSDAENDEYSGSVTIPKTVTYNGTTYDVTSIGFDAFGGCSSLTNVTIPNSIASIGGSAFGGCSSLTSITIPNSVIGIGGSAFAGCSSLISVTIPNSVTIIGDYAFVGCTFMQDNFVNNSNLDTEENNYWGATICDYEIDGLCIRNDTVVDCRPSVSSVTIPNSVTSIGSSAFEDCSSLTSVTIPNSVTCIGSSAFTGCSSLTSVTIPNSVTCIGSSAFTGCSSLTSITIPNSVTSIGDRAFAGCSSLTSITIPNSVTTVGGGMFYGCSKLKSVVLSNNITSLPSYNGFSYPCGFFENCSSLTSVTIPNSVTSIGDLAFSNCSFLTSVTIGNGITSIENEAFLNCKSLNSIKIEAITPPTLGRYVHDGGRLPIIYIPDNTLSAYQQAWGNEYTYINNETTLTIHVETPGTLKDLIVDAGTRPILVSKLILTGSLNADDFTCMRETMTSLVDVDLSGITNTSGVYFYNKENLVRVILPINLTSIEDGAFAYCSSLTSITIPNSVTSIGDRAFAGCTSLTFIVVNNGNTTYNSRENCNAIIETSTNTLIAGCRNTIIPNSVTSIGDYAFYYYSSLSSITIPNSVTSIGDSAFYRCFGLTAVTIGNSVTSIGNSAFYYCRSLTSVTIPNSVTSIEGHTFYGCSNLDSVIIGNGVQSIGDNAFDACKSLDLVTIPNSVTNIGDYAFSNCHNLSSIIIGNGVKNIGYNAFDDCYTLDTVTCLAMTPPALDWSFDSYDDIILLVPCEALSDYWRHEVWEQFINIECISSEEVETEDVVIEYSTTTVTVTWPTEERADTYTIVIKKGNEVFSTLTFNADGQLLNIAFAPGRDGNHPVQYAEQAGKGFRFTITGLTEATQYAYNITTKDAANQTIATYSGEFTTMGDTTTDMDNIQSPISNCQKILRNGQFIIVRDGVEYNAVGQEIGN